MSVFDFITPEMRDDYAEFADKFAGNYERLERQELELLAEHFSQPYQHIPGQGISTSDNYRMEEKTAKCIALERTWAPLEQQRLDDPGVSWADLKEVFGSIIDDSQKPKWETNGPES